MCVRERERERRCMLANLFLDSNSSEEHQCRSRTLPSAAALSFDLLLIPFSLSLFNHLLASLPHLHCITFPSATPPVQGLFTNGSTYTLRVCFRLRFFSTRLCVYPGRQVASRGTYVACLPHNTTRSPQSYMIAFHIKHV